MDMQNQNSTFRQPHMSYQRDQIVVLFQSYGNKNHLEHVIARIDQ